MINSDPPLQDIWIQFLWQWGGEWKNISTKGTYCEDDPYGIFYETFEYFLNYTVFNVQGYDMEKYVMEQPNVSQGATKLDIQSQLDVLKSIDHCEIGINSAS